MTKVLISLVYLWNKKIYILLPTLALPLLTLAWSLGYQPAYEAVTTLGVNKNLVSSPLLKNLNQPENTSILERRLRNSKLLRDTLKDSGLIFDAGHATDSEINALTAQFSDRIALTPINDESFQISYKNPTRANATRILETLSANFIDDILAPERLRTEEKLMKLAEQVQYYSEVEKKHEAKLNKQQQQLAKTSNEKKQNALLKDVVKLEFEAQKAAAQKDLAQEDYETLLTESRSLITGARGTGSNLILQYIEAPTVISGDRTLRDHIHLTFLSLKIGLLIGLLSLLIGRLTDKTLRTDQEIHDAFGLRILGRIPNLGEVSMNEGRLIVDPSKTRFKA